MKMKINNSFLIKCLKIISLFPLLLSLVWPKIIDIDIDMMMFFDKITKSKTDTLLLLVFFLYKIQKKIKGQKEKGEEGEVAMVVDRKWIGIFEERERKQEQIKSNTTINRQKERELKIKAFFSLHYTITHFHLPFLLLLLLLF